jgi:hypothetical protein
MLIIARERRTENLKLVGIEDRIWQTGIRDVQHICSKRKTGNWKKVKFDKQGAGYGAA